MTWILILYLDWHGCYKCYICNCHFMLLWRYFMTFLLFAATLSNLLSLYAFIMQSGHWGINPLKNTTVLFFAKRPLKSANCPSRPPDFLGNPSIYIGFLWTPLKNWIFQWTPIMLKFLVLNPIHILKVTKFLAEFPVW